MRARADATEQTRRRILDATIALAEEKILAQIVLSDVAERAAVSVQTLLRHFGSRDGLLDAARAHAAAQVTEERHAPVGDVGAAVAAIVAHYERRGDFVLKLLAQAQFDDAAAGLVGKGKQLHRDWVAETFAPQLTARTADAEALVDVLVVATDVYAWALLRRDRGLDAATTQRRILRIVRALLDPDDPGVVT